jgi:acetyl-CoA carboxylase, biotin carboxylase subunit
MNSISRVLIANRGEIALRIIQACRDLNIETVAAVSEVDRESLPAKLADRTICIGPAQPVKSYLQVETLVVAAMGTGADAIHPGYGFLAEQPELPEACVQHGIIFIGPRSEHIRRMGDKLWARRTAESLGIPVIPGSGLIQESSQLASVAEKMGYPVLLKAAAGGGGKGMKIVRRPEELQTMYHEASAEARSAFGDGRVYVEAYIPNARHVEIQMLGDRQGNIVHLFERDCSLQRRHQKILEEAPCPILSADLRKEVCQAALTLAHQVKYESAGTIEFILDQDKDLFYFLEMNTRIQVEHPVTEMITGIDLVKEQIRIAAGFPLSFSQEDVKVNGHALECRINAESPQNQFLPSPGEIIDWRPPSGENIRLDSHGYTGYMVQPYYDSLLAKLITRGENRSAAIRKMQEALSGFVIKGVDTSIPFHQRILENSEYREGKINTKWIEDVLLPQIQKS